MSAHPDYSTRRNTDLCIVLVGAGCIGAKSCVLMRYLYDRFIDSYDPTIEDSYYVDIEVDGETTVAKIIGLWLLYV